MPLAYMPWLKTIPQVRSNNPDALWLWEDGGEGVCCDAFCDHLVAPEVIMDVGAGYGHASRHFKERFPSATVVPVDFYSFETEEHQPYPARLVVDDAHELHRQSHSVHALWAAHILEHLQSPLDALREWRRVLCHGHRGLLGVVVPRASVVESGHVWDFSDPRRLYYLMRLTGFDVVELVRRTYNIAIWAHPGAEPTSHNLGDLGVPEHVEVRDL